MMWAFVLPGCNRRCVPGRGRPQMRKDTIKLNVLPYFLIYVLRELLEEGPDFKLDINLPSTHLALTFSEWWEDRQRVGKEEEI